MARASCVDSQLQMCFSECCCTYALLDGARRGWLEQAWGFGIWLVMQLLLGCGVASLYNWVGPQCPAQWLEWNAPQAVLLSCIRWLSMPCDAKSDVPRCDTPCITDGFWLAVQCRAEKRLAHCSRPWQLVVPPAALNASPGPRHLRMS